MARLNPVISPLDEVVFLAGDTYREFLQGKLDARTNPTATPLNKMAIGEQLQWYSKLFG
jgi:hypothetical protein